MIASSGVPTPMSPKGDNTATRSAFNHQYVNRDYVTDQ
jgi:hypothetical protein